MCCGGCDEHLSSLLQGLAEPLVICPSSRHYRIKASRAIKTLTKIKHWARLQSCGLAQLAWSITSVPCIMVSQRRSGNTKMQKWKGIGSYHDTRLISVPLIAAPNTGFKSRISSSLYSSVISCHGYFQLSFWVSAWRSKRGYRECRAVLRRLT